MTEAAAPVTQTAASLTEAVAPTTTTGRTLYRLAPTTTTTDAPVTAGRGAGHADGRFGDRGRRADDDDHRTGDHDH